MARDIMESQENYSEYYSVGGKLMTQKNLSRWLKAVIIVGVLVGVGVYGWFVPMAAQEYRASYPEFAWAYPPFLAFILGTGLPCFASLFFAWKIAAEIGRDNSFSRINAKHMKVIAILALCDVIYFRVGLIVFALLGASSAPILITTVFIDIAGLAISVCSAALSHLILKAAVMREENDMTI